MSLGPSTPPKRISELTVGAPKLSDYETAVRFDQNGIHDEAIKWYQQALDGCEKALGADNIATIEVASKLAQTYHKKFTSAKKCLKEQNIIEPIFTDALNVYQRVLNGQRGALGEKHRETLRTFYRIANIFYEFGNCQTALGVFQDVLDSQKETLEGNDPDIIATITAMADCLDSLAEFERAHELYEQALGFWEERKGTGNRNIEGLHIADKLIKNTTKIGDGNEPAAAVSWYEFALELLEKWKGMEYEETLTMVTVIADNLFTQKKYLEARALYVRAFAVYDRKFGKDHKLTRDAAYGVASSLSQF